MDPSGQPLYEQVKAKVLSGEMTPKQAHAFIVENAQQQSHIVSKVA